MGIRQDVWFPALANILDYRACVHAALNEREPLFPLLEHAVADLFEVGMAFDVRA